MAQEQGQQRARQWGQIVARAWTDPAFKQRLLANPTDALREGGIDVPADTEVRVIEDTEQVRHLVLPPKPTAELSDELLDRVAAGTFLYSMCAPGP